MRDFGLLNKYGHWARGWSLPSKLAFVVICASFFGACLTSYVVFIPGNPYLMQVFASSVKVPTLLLVSSSVSFIIVLCFTKLFVRILRTKDLFEPAIACLIATAALLAVWGPIISIISVLGNYTITIFSSYFAFVSAGLFGCFWFYKRLAREKHESFPYRTIALLWCLCFGLISAEAGWTMRPFVGWTGQPFSWYRSDGAEIWNQLYCEARNLRFGGVRFPSAGEASDAKAWPC